MIIHYVTVSCGTESRKKSLAAQNFEFDSCRVKVLCTHDVLPVIKESPIKMVHLIDPSSGVVNSLLLAHKQDDTGKNY